MEQYLHLQTQAQAQTEGAKRSTHPRTNSCMYMLTCYDYTAALLMAKTLHIVGRCLQLNLWDIGLSLKKASCC